MPDITPVNYKLHLKPDLANFSFTGCTELVLDVQKPITEIFLNILEIAVWNCSVQQNDVFRPCAFRVDPGKEELCIILPEQMRDRITVKIDYQGLINNKMAGFYRSAYLNDEDIRFIAVTQFQESDARRAFPCLDYPAKKATFDIAIDIEQDQAAISNTAVKEEKPLKHGKKRVVFERTPKMSTYLVFFGVGEFEVLEDEIDRRVRVVTLPGMKDYARFGLEFGRKSLAFTENYYGIPYPLPKLDLIAIPDFAFGAMENWGAITFRENLLLHYPEITSKSGEIRICNVIAHEIAHQWFGNLVTPSDWKYLWLNESFATYFGYGVIDHYFPQWDVWEQFMHDSTASALSRDGLHETFAIEIPGDEHIIINAATAPIIYDKGGSILRQVQAYIGKENFQKGLQHYLRTHEYGCAASHHLWESFEHASEQPVGAMMKSWIEQPGFPLIQAKRDGDRLSLKQKRFTCLPMDSGQKWLVPITVNLFNGDGTSEQMNLLLDKFEKTVEIGENAVAYKVNHRQTGFYRVEYLDSENLKELGLRVQQKTLSPEDRWGLQNDLFALVKSGAVALRQYLRFLTHYKNEDAFLPLTSIAANLAEAYLIVDRRYQQEIASVAKPWFETILARIGFEPTGDEKHTISILRDRIIWHAALYGSEPVMDFARKQFESLSRGDTVHPDILKSVMQVGAWTGGQPALEWLDQRFQSSEIEHERLNILVAIGCFRETSLIEKSQQYVLEIVPDRNKFIPVVAMASNPHAAPLMWDWYLSNLKAIEQFHPVFYERIIAAIVPVAGMQKAEAVNAFFSDYLQKNETFKDIIKLSLERLKINLRMRDMNAA